MKNILLFLSLGCVCFLNTACSIEVTHQVNIHEDVATCGLGVNSDGSPAIAELMKNNPQLQAHYQDCLAQYNQQASEHNQKQN
jgi:hypothetical protein